MDTEPGNSSLHDVTNDTDSCFNEMMKMIMSSVISELEKNDTKIQIKKYVITPILKIIYTELYPYILVLISVIILILLMCIVITIICIIDFCF